MKSKEATKKTQVATVAISRRTEFFKKDTYSGFYDASVWKATRKWLLDNGSRLLLRDEANALGHTRLFDSLIWRIDPMGDYVGALPAIRRKNVSYTPIVYSASDHDKKTIDGFKISHIVEQYFNQRHKKKYLLSADSDQLIAIEMERFTYTHFEMVRSGFEETPFILFDGDLREFVIMCDDYPFSVVSEHQGAYSQVVAGRSREFWVSAFNTRISDACLESELNDQFIELLNTSFIPRLAGVNNIEITS